ncbi:sorcin-like [Chlorella sorokiniana]|uniref:Sorcin-like n=1 Tax=Chlorella sorokiniana TaxID=3076 RepID=A0A2P6TUU6_CHLSO|nr:sorcin-like [Chlorella sorokiniana]|eukprot:PRW57843.1 sorcin-like [Chlorella sorokiniana]
MALGGLHFSLQACSQMVRLHDRDSSGTISIDEFRTLHLQLTEIKAGWTAAAAGGDSISAQQAQQLIAQQGYRLEGPALTATCQAFDPDRNGRFGLPEYTMLCLFLKSCQNIFRAFDPQGTGRISLDVSQFVYCAAHTK